ncbi:MAG: LVIVD repeat-containing protein, partial [Candidatus Binataceae bacterium]
TQGFLPEPPPPAGHEKERRVPVAQKDRFRGVRIFDISDIKNPKQVAAVQTCRGSHTHTLVVDPNDKDNVYIYVSGTSFVRQPEELAGCSGGEPDKNPNTALFRIDVIKVPLAAPQDAKVVSSPRVFIDPRTGALNGLNNGGSHDKDEKKPVDTDQCHDITVYSAIGLAAGACSGNGILLDIKDPVHPKRVDAVNDPNYSYWHSATFSNDGTKVVFTDEWGGGLGARCRPNDPNKWGADAIFHLKGDNLSLASYYKLPAAQGDTENCVAHNGSLIPVPGRDIEVQAWYQGGVSIMDFTDAAHPYEIAYFDRGPIDAKMLVLGGDWSAYWYNGYIYGSEIARGLDVFELTPTKFLTQNEIDAAKTVRVAELNVQNQQKLEWPAKLVVAKAYVDQLERSQALPANRIAALRKAIQSAERSHMSKSKLAKLKGMAASLDASATAATSPADSARLHALANILQHPAA